MLWIPMFWFVVQMLLVLLLVISKSFVYSGLLTDVSIVGWTDLWWLVE
jgi:hypothetical protein